MKAISRFGCALAVGALLSGCGGDKAMEKRLNAMRDEMTRMQADQDRLDERMGAMEMQRIASTPRGTAVADASVQHPRLKVIKLTPNSEPGASGEAEEPLEDSAEAAPGTGPRPVLRSRGSQVEADIPDESPAPGQTSPRPEPRKK